jgi:hypothetical protein
VIGDNLANLDLSTLTMIVGGTGGVQTQYGNFAPRIGFSDSIAHNTVLRGGFGVSYFPTNQNNGMLLINPPYSYATGTLVDLTTSISQGMPAPAPSSTTDLSGSLNTTPLNYRTGYMEQFNLFLQHDFSGNVVTAGYVGELGRHIQRQFDNIDIASPNGTATPGPAPYATQLPNVNTILLYGDEGSSSYNALQLNFERQYLNGFMMGANYTLAHGLDNATAGGPGNGEGTGLLPYEDPHYDWGNATLDVRHRIAVYASYSLPFGRKATGLRKTVTSGWQLNGLGFWQTGTPFTVLSSIQHIDVSPTVTTDRPSVRGNPNGGGQSIDQFFKISDFYAQPAGTPGNEARNQLYGPHARRVDLSLFKLFDVRESVKAEFRAECFNISNTPNFLNPNNIITAYDSNGVATNAGGFGSITQTNPNIAGRQFQFAMKILF